MIDSAAPSSNADTSIPTASWAPRTSDASSPRSTPAANRRRSLARHGGPTPTGGDTDAGDAFGARLPLPLGTGAAVLRGPAAGRGGHRDAHLPGREPRAVPGR